MTPEKKIKEKVKKLLKEKGVYYHMPVQMGYGAPSLDFICCYYGIYFAIETKAPGKKLTPRQEDTKKRINAAGGRVFIIDGDLDELESWL